MVWATPPGCSAQPFPGRVGGSAERVIFVQQGGAHLAAQRQRSRHPPPRVAHSPIVAEGQQGRGIEQEQEPIQWPAARSV